jgi:hypothetical protein
VASKEATRVVEQAELALTRRAEPNSMPIEVVRRQKNSAAAFCLAIQSSGLDDQEIYRCLSIDAGYFSRMKKGEATLQADLIEPFCTVVNNRIYPEWIAYRCGCTLVQIQSEAERLLEVEKARRVEAETKVRVLMEAIAGKVSA